MFSFKKKPSILTAQNNSEDLKDRLFFHDMINQTHGLILFLNQKDMSGKGLESEEVRNITREIKTLQSLIRDHYDFKHKNLVQTFDWVPFSYAKMAYDQLSETYFDAKNIKAKFSLQDESTAEVLVYYPCFYRILNNLIKNISESNTLEVDFTFILKDEGLSIVTKNLMNFSGTNDMSEHLSRVILSENLSNIQGLGLESIHHLAEENGGDFSFEIADHSWINRIFLPSFKWKSKKSVEKIPA